MNGVTHERIERLARRFWEERGRPLGSPEIDWLRAERKAYGVFPKLAREVGTLLGRLVRFIETHLP
jgi:hypothetical protein